MITVYVIESLMDKTWYTGMTKDYVNRLKEHNSGKNRFTKGHRPWKIIYTENLADWEAARKKEKYLKSAAGKNWLKKYLALNNGDTSSLPA
jgi:putative endonuclease